MATEKTRKRKPAARSTGGPSVKKAKITAKKRTKVRRDSAEKDNGYAGVERRIEQRLERLEKRPEKKAKRTPSIEPQPMESETGSFDVPVKKLRPSPAKSRDGSLKSGLKRILSLLPGSRPHDYDKLIETLEHMDEFGKVPDIETKFESLMMFLYEKYWRVNTSGIEKVPSKGRTLIVANHSGVIPFDGAMIATAIYKFHPARRHARFLIEDWFGQLPFATQFMNAVGQVRACQENAERLLRHDQLVGVFPEGIKGMAKGFKNRYNLARFGRGGVIRLAIKTGTPVVPCAVVGAEEIYIVLGYANWLGKMFGMPLFPITATFPWLGLLGFLPLPTKWYIQFGDVISYDEYGEEALSDNVIVNRLNRQLRSTIQDMVDSALKKRRSLFFG
ncbi:MAG: glycerol acyltransferase [Candidatus Abyssobacteria bacterium SURF_5]|uniref:Glycerol acyltransferase n=1 Tax=Abyssobacteria bacterium (strain SURF_5) TaxID=2093360 RepID=A0A3A4NPJ2_ABYX5|nr:MAG: glycerol acyltransferase [Candidatus Abyssubacteria bacterium SURF_5]